MKLSHSLRLSQQCMGHSATSIAPRNTRSRFFSGTSAIDVSRRSRSIVLATMVHQGPPGSTTDVCLGFDSGPTKLTRCTQGLPQDLARVNPGSTQGPTRVFPGFTWVQPGSNQGLPRVYTEQGSDEVLSRADLEPASGLNSNFEQLDFDR